MFFVYSAACLYYMGMYKEAEEQALQVRRHSCLEREEAECGSMAMAPVPGVQGAWAWAWPGQGLKGVDG